MSNALQSMGSTGKKYVPIYTDRLFTGLWTNRNPLRDATSTFYQSSRGNTKFDTMIDGSNVEISNKLTLIRRPGMSQYNSATFPAINAFYEFRQFTANSETISVMADTASTVYDATGPSTQTSIFTKSGGSGQTYFQGVGNTLYFGNGVDQEKYLNTGSGFNTQLWGIAIGSVNNATGPNIAGSGANDASSLTAWTNPANVNSTVAFATVTPAFPAGPPQFFRVSKNDISSGHAFAIPATTAILGFTVSMDVQLSVAPVGTALYGATLVKAGVPVGPQKTVQVTTAPFQTITFGGTSDLWGSTWSSGDVNSTTFGVAVQAYYGGSVPVPVFSVRNVRITVYGIGGPTVAVSGSAGTFSATVGYRYVFAFGNSVSGHVSNSTTPSSSTGVFASKLNVSVSLTASTDPQVNQIRVFRTADGGSTYLELPTSPYPNTTAAILDAAPDVTLNTFSIAPTTTSNTPPPSGLIALTYHLGRVWGAVNNTVYYSGGPDTYTGNGNEAFPPLNFFIFPSKVVRLWPSGQGLIVFTVSDIYIITGTSIGTFASSPFIDGIGLLSYNAWDVNGTTVYMLSSDGQTLALDPTSGVTEISEPIADKIAAYSGTAAYVAWLVNGDKDKALFVANGSTGWYRWASSASPENAQPWSPFATITGGCGAIQSVEVSPGVHRLLVGPTSSGPILQRDFSVSQDNGSNFTGFATIGSLVLAQPCQVAELQAITVESALIGSRPTISTLLNEVSGSFQILTTFVNDPPQLATTTTLYSNRYYMAQNGQTQWCRHMQLKIGFVSENAANEVYTYTIIGANHEE